MIYLDNAGTTKMLTEVLEEYNNSAEDFFYNPSALYKNANIIKKKISDSKDIILKTLNAKGKLIFTSGATESNNTIIRSCVRDKQKKYLFSIVEHPSVYNVAIDLKNQGYNIEFVNVTQEGIIDEEDFKSKLSPDVSFISIMHVNNETGAINDLKKLNYIAKNVSSNVIFHSDGVQSFCKVKINISDLGIDAYTISAHKINGPKGIGGLYFNDSLNIKPFIIGGGQENGIRSGTENTYAIFAFAKAVEILQNSLDQSRSKILLLKQKLVDCINAIPNTIIVSDENTSPYILSSIFKFTRAETILNMLEDEGIIVGNGSACSSKKSDNRILKEMGYTKDEIMGNIRFSFNVLNTQEEIEKVIQILPQVIEKYRQNTKGK